MKRFLSLLFVCILFPLFSLADSLSFLGVPTYWVMWAQNVFGVTGIEEEISTSRDNDNLTVTTMDKISAYTNPQSLEVEKLSLMFYDANLFYSEEQKQTLANKAMSFFCAIEGGNFLTISKEDAGSAVKKAIDMYDAMSDVINNQHTDLWNGKYVSFCASEQGTYYLRLLYHTRYYIYFVPSGQPALGAAQTVSRPTDQTSEGSGKSLSEVLNEQEEWKARFKSATETRMKEYYDTVLDDFSLTVNAETGSVQAMNIYFTWDVNNSEERTKKMLEMFSDDLAATLHNKYPDIEIESMTVFWKVPELFKTGYAAKYRYSSKGSKIYLQKKMGPLYGNN